MQSFLGAALFFHNHVPDYSEWSAKLYETFIALKRGLDAEKLAKNIDAPCNSNKGIIF